MTLSFSTKWPERMGDKAGQPNHFIEKIWSSPIWNTIEGDGYYDFRDEHFWKFISFWDGAWTDEGETHFPFKAHTLRSDSFNRWQPGMDIHMVINNRTKNRFQFAPVVKCKSVQTIEIREKYMTAYDCFILNNEKIFTVEVDGLFLPAKRIEELAINDGFDSVEDFFAYFNTDFEGKIIHWTDLKY